MAKLQLTDVERLSPANQYDTLGLLKRDDGYTKMAENLRDGHKWIYEQHATKISENLPDEDAEHVLTILGIYSELRDNYKQLSDKSGIDEHAVTFAGFDGNNEAELLHFARALSKNNSYAETQKPLLPALSSPLTSACAWATDQPVPTQKVPYANDQARCSP